MDKMMMVKVWLDVKSSCINMSFSVELLNQEATISLVLILMANSTINKVYFPFKNGLTPPTKF